MAKAILGYVGGPDPRMIAEMRRLQQRVRDLEAELVRLQEENDALAAEVDQDLLVSTGQPMLAREPALT
jgi:cell division protein FtsB